MTISRTPTLDALLSGSASAKDMTESAAHKAAADLFGSNAPLRTPRLDSRLGLARREFNNPAYVDAILRNMAALPARELYDPDDLARLASADVLGHRIDTSSVASVASGLIDCFCELRSRLEARESAGEPADPDDAPPTYFYEIEELKELFDIFVTPFNKVWGRLNMAHVSSREGSRSEGAATRGRITSASQAAIDYRSLARRLDMRPAASTYLLLRFCFLPARRYVSGMKRLGSRIVRPSVGIGGEWMLGTYLDYPGSESDLGESGRLLCLQVLGPLAELGVRQGLVGCQQPDDTPLFD